METRPLALLVAVLLAGCFEGPDPEEPNAREPRGTALVASSQKIAAEVGALVLRAGGNAVDAAAAVQFSLNVVEPSMSGIGGGTFLLLWLNETKEIVFLDGRETSPAASTPDQFQLPGGGEQPFDYAHRQGYAVGVPGTLALFDHALTRFGSRPLPELLQPAIVLAEDGFPVSERLSGLIAAEKEKLESWPASAAIFLKGSVCAAPPVGCTGGTPYAPGEVLRNPDLAKTFRALAEEGPGAFYDGPIGGALIDAQAQRQGRMTTDDLRSYAVKPRDPIRFSFQGRDVVSAPPPSSGGLTMGEALLVAEPYELALRGGRSVDALHLLIEAFHLAYADRAAFMGDADYRPVPIRGLLHPDYIDERRALIDEARANPNIGPGDPWRYDNSSGLAIRGRPEAEKGAHTTHYVVVDAWGNVAAVTTTLENLFGTGMVVPGYGFLLNNQLTDFDFTPGGPNQVEAGKRPRSSMTPTLVLEEGEPILALGSPGGPTIITSVAQVLLNVIEYGMELGDAVDAARIYSSAWPTVVAEPGIDDATRLGLIARGHQVQMTDSRIGIVQAALRSDDGSWTGVADPRSSEGGVATVYPASGSD